MVSTCGASGSLLALISRVVDGGKMPNNVHKWQTWGLVTAYKIMLEDVATCRDCRQTMWEQARAWGITDLIIERMAHIEDPQNTDNK